MSTLDLVRFEGQEPVDESAISLPIVVSGRRDDSTVVEKLVGVSDSLISKTLSPKLFLIA